MKAFELTHSIQLADGGILTKLTLRRPRLKDVLAMNRAAAAAGGDPALMGGLAPANGTRPRTDSASAATAAGPADLAASTALMAGALALVASMSDVEEQDLAEIDLDDFTRLQEALADFFPAAPSAARAA